MRNILLRKRTWYAVLLAAGVFACMQLFQPAIESRSITGELMASDTVRSIFRQACYDCHSNETRLAWFDNIAPGSWMVAKDIREGRSALNFSEWDKLSNDRQKGVLFEAYNHIQFKAMPLPVYLLLHPGARIGAPQIEQLRDYLRTLMVRPAPDSVRTKGWQQQYDSWIKQGSISREIRPSLNGMLFESDFNDWAAISTTVRTDNGTLKMILGNAIAVAAVKSGHVNPWPDGAILAKVTWTQMPDASGAVEAGEFKQVAFMVKGARRYRSTGGWGFSQWDKGIELVPHGKDGLFPTECVNCHRPMRDNDLVFTIPVEAAMIPGPENRVITMFADEERHTMSTLYGNDIAVRYARSSFRGAVYPPGSVLELMTWRRREDDHWFGAEIPGKVESIEKVIIPDNPERQSSPVYEKYQGEPLKKTAVENARERIDLILSRPAGVLPTSRHPSAQPSAF